MIEPIFSLTRNGKTLILDEPEYGVTDYSGLEATDYDLEKTVNTNYIGERLKRKKILSRPISISADWLGFSGGFDLYGSNVLGCPGNRGNDRYLGAWMEMEVHSAFQDERAGRTTEEYHQYRPRRDTSGDLFPRTGGQSQDHQSFHG